MKFKLEIDCDGAAFEDDAADEINRILNSLDERLPRMAKSQAINLFDINGNSVGRAWFEGD